MMDLLERLDERLAWDRPMALCTATDEYTVLRPREVVLIQGHDHRVEWTTDRGVLPTPDTSLAIQGVQRLPAQVRPEFLKVGAATFLNRRRLRSLRWVRADKHCHLATDTDLAIPVHAEMMKPLAEALGLQDLYHLPMTEAQMALWQEGCRDFPIEIIDMDKATLQRHFQRQDGTVDGRRLLANFIWELYRRRSQGLPLSVEFPLTPRGFVYRPVFTVLRTLGLDGELTVEMTGDKVRLFEDIGLFGSADVVSLWTKDLLALLATFVGEYRLFTYQELGFKDPKPTLRRIGTARPLVLLLAEKDGLFPIVEEAGRRWDVSGLALSGNPSWMDTDFFAASLTERVGAPAPVHIFTAVDYDPYGWILAEAFAMQLKRYGYETANLTHLVTPERLSAAEIQKYAYSVDSKDPHVHAKVVQWLKKGGGIGGQSMGFHSDDMWPRERILAAFQEQAGLQEVQG